MIITRNFSVRYMGKLFCAPFSQKMRFSFDGVALCEYTIFFCSSFTRHSLIRCGVFLHFCWLLAKKFLHWISSPCSNQFASIVSVSNQFLGLSHFLWHFFCQIACMFSILFFSPFFLSLIAHKRDATYWKMNSNETSNFSIKPNDSTEMAMCSLRLYNKVNAHYLSHHLI